MPRLANKLILFVLLLALPILSYGLASVTYTDVQSDYHAALRDEYSMISPEVVLGVSLDKVCAAPYPGLGDVCTAVQNLKWVRQGALIAGVSWVAVLLVISFSGWLSRENFSFMASWFRQGFILCIAFLASLCAMHVLLITAALYYAGFVFVGETKGLVFAIDGILSVSVFLLLTRWGLAFIRPVPINALARILPPERAPQFWSLVTASARQLGVRPPQNIVVGLAPTLFMTASEVKCLDGTLTGRTLYCSLPLCRLLSTDELFSLIGHELHHFKGRNKTYSEKVLPIYRTTKDSLANLHVKDNRILKHLLLWPVTNLLNFYLDCFATALERLTSRREKKADLAGAKIRGRETFGSALFKMHLLRSVWKMHQDSALRDLNNGRSVTNYSQYYLERLPKKMEPKCLEGIAAISLNHPIDTHPGLAARLDALGLDVSNVLRPSFEHLPPDSVLSSIPKVEMLEAELSKVYQRILANKLELV
jgi:Zn-dependent protease with chaperone function